MSSIITTCPQAIRTKNRRTKKSKIYASESWKKNKQEFVKGKVCAWCGATEKLLPHHPYKDTPDGVYEDLYLSECVVLCGTCHFMLERRHKVKCPVCRKNWMPCDPSISMCFPCHLKANPEKAEELKKAKEYRDKADREYKEALKEKRKQAKKKHPCKLYRVGGKCGASGFMCGHSPTKAEGKCADFVSKI